MIPAKFDYVKPGSVEEAVTALAEGGEDAKIIAGGQSLLPVLRLRLAAPSLLVDLGGIAELKGIREDGDGIVDRGDDPVLRGHRATTWCRSTSRCWPRPRQTVADNQVRHRGTLGGALAHADPAGDLGAPALALDAEMTIAGPSGTPHRLGGGLLRGLLHHRARRGRDPHRDPVPEVHGLGQPLREVQPHGAGVVDVRGGGGGAGRGRHRSPRPASGSPTWARRRSGPRAVEQALVGQPATAEAVRAAAEHATEGTAAPSDADAASDYREHLAKVLTGRAVLAAAG